MSKDDVLTGGAPESSSRTPNDGNFTELGLEKDATSRPSSPSIADGSLGGSLGDKDEYPHGLMLVCIIVALLLSIFLVALDMTILATAIPRITDEFHAIDHVGWYGSSFFLTLAVFQSFWGKIYRYYNLKISFLIAGFIFELGSLLCAVSQNSTTLILGRAVTGWGAAGLFGGSYTIIAFIAPPAKRPAYTGLVGTAYAVASVAGPLLGGIFTDTVSWRWCFYINLPIGAVSLGLMFLFFKPPASAKPVPAPLREIILQLDIPGAATILAALVCFLLVTEWAGVTRPWSSAPVVACLVMFGVLVLAFIFIQVRQAERGSLVPRLLKQRTLTGVCAFAFFQNGTNFLITYYLPIYFQAIDNVSAARSGIYNLPLILGSCLCAALSGYLITLVGYYTHFMVIGSSLFTIGAGLMYTLDIGTPLANAIGYQVLLGVGQGIGIQMPIIVGQAFSQDSDMSSTTAIVLFFQMMGGTMCISAGQSMFGNTLLQSLRNLAPQIDAATVVTIGASDLRQNLPADQIEVVLISYMAGLRNTFALGVAIAGCAFVCSWIAPILSLKKVKVSPAEAVALKV